MRDLLWMRQKRSGSADLKAQQSRRRDLWRMRRSPDAWKVDRRPGWCTEGGTVRGDGASGYRNDFLKRKKHGTAAEGSGVPGTANGTQRDCAGEESDLGTGAHRTTPCRRRDPYGADKLTEKMRIRSPQIEENNHRKMLAGRCLEQKRMRRRTCAVFLTAKKLSRLLYRRWPKRKALQIKAWKRSRFCSV